MAAAPPPPPDPNHFNSFPFKSSCSTSRPALRRSKTLANPEGATTWRREPLLDVTNFVLGGGSFQREGRLQRVPTPTLLAPSAAPSTLQSSSPTASPSPRRRLRRTQSDIPSSSSPSSSFPSTPTTDSHSNDPPASPSPLGGGGGLGTRTRRRTTASPTTTAAGGVGGAGGASRSTRARTADSATPTPAVVGTRRTRSSLPVVLEEGARGEEDEAGDAQRRLRRRRTSTGGFR